MIVQEFLTEKNIAFEAIEHVPTFDARSMARAVHVSGDQVAKAVLLKADGDYVLAVLPATHAIDFQKVMSILNADTVQLASERECAARFRDCELGARPPFGSDYALKTLMDESLLNSDELVFEANTHREAIRMKTQDYQDLEHPQLSSFTRRR